jgi:hypothetical protein
VVVVAAVLELDAVLAEEAVVVGLARRPGQEAHRPAAHGEEVALVDPIGDAQPDRVAADDGRDAR